MSHAGLQIDFSTHGFSQDKNGQYRYYTLYDSIYYRRVTMEDDNIINQTTFKFQIPTKLIVYHNLLEKFILLEII